jgi:hypothetical protein
LILERPIPNEWEVRRTKEDDVYFFNQQENKPTACLWRDPTAKSKRTALPVPLPPGCRLTGYKTEKPGSGLEETSVFEHVLESKQYCELREFFSEAFLKSLEEEAKEPIPHTKTTKFDQDLAKPNPTGRTCSYPCFLREHFHDYY